MIRVAAVGDVHVGLDSAGRLAPRLAGLADHADVFLLAGDLTHRGRPGRRNGRSEEGVPESVGRTTLGRAGQDRRRVAANLAHIFTDSSDARRVL